MWFHSKNHLVKHKMSLFLNFEQMIADIIAKSPLCVLITGDLNVRLTLHDW